jgi:predicted Rdx family selenoprotein
MARMNKSTYETRTSEDGILFMQWRQWLAQELYSSVQPRTLPDVRYGEHIQSESSIQQSGVFVNTRKQDGMINSTTKNKKYSILCTELV